ncbi:CD225/dispanin family protein [Dysgonomonas sp. 521]|uniref:CD225/dispanin family protein n=1 Tax=Dysgonomonas sp. 521 TaxID=2302932 RepID=UPI0013D08FCA|nr:CD225/dispanin family protein [Dysgonomonas sp. 521]NDV94000.1 CD225/dispanin family protein [Dysgonomonas sp. 521]
MSEFNQENQNYQSSPYQMNYNQMDNLDEFSRPKKPDNNLALSIVGTVLGLCSPCCIGLILGIVAIVFSTQVDSKYNMGDYHAAQGNAQKAKIFALIAIGLFALNLIYLIVVLITGGMDAVMGSYKEYLDQIN